MGGRRHAPTAARSDADVSAVLARSRRTRADRLRVRATRRLRAAVAAVVPVVVVADVLATHALC